MWTLVVLLLVFHLGAGWYYSSRIINEGFTPDPNAIEEVSGNYSLESVTYQSTAGEFDAWHLPGSGTTWVIHVHGLNVTPAEPEPVFEAIQQAGYHQLAITYRNDQGQPADPSAMFQYGATEWEDVLGAVEFARSMGAEDIVFAGYSTGASHVLSYAYRHNFDDIAGLILDSPNIDMADTVDYRASIEPLPVVPFNVPPTVAPIARFFTSLRIGVNWISIDYVEKAERSLRVPVLIFHGTEDDSIPVRQAEGLVDAQPSLVRLVRVEGAGHVDSFNTNNGGYLAEVLTFLSGLD